MATDMATYKNSFYKNDPRNTREFLTCDSKPVEYKGFQIYHRLSEVFDIVKAGVCVGMCAGLNGAKRHIDKNAKILNARVI